MITQKKTWTVKELLTWITNKFQNQNFETPLLDAQLLVCHALKYKNRVDLYLNSDAVVGEKELLILRELIKRRLSCEPVAYILNQKFWYDLDLYIDSSVLIPRPETEVLLDFIIETVKQRDITPKIIFDLGTGSGCLAIALGKHFPEAKVCAIDISTQALNTAKKNALRNNINNIEFIEANLLDRSTFLNLKEKYGCADIIVANPPYVTEDEWSELANDIKLYEPKSALVSNNFGLEIASNIYKHTIECNLLKDSSIFGMELAHGQPETLLSENDSTFKLAHNMQLHEKPINNWFILKDLDNKERFLIKISGLKHDADTSKNSEYDG